MRKMISLRRLACCSSVAGGLAALTAGLGWAGPSFQGIEKAVAVMRPTQGSQVEGIVIFSQVEGKIEIYARLKGLPAGTRHGFHVHEFGDCSAADGSSAGAHYDPTMNMPGMHQHGMRPLGDLEDLSASETGTVEVRFSAPGLSIAGAENAILGRGILLHESFADPNDPMSSSGSAIACGTIGVYNAVRGE